MPTTYKTSHIVFSPLSSAVIQAGRKTQLRLVMEPQPPEFAGGIYPGSVAKHDPPYIDSNCVLTKTLANPRGMSRMWYWWTEDDRQGPHVGTSPLGVPGDRIVAVQPDLTLAITEVRVQRLQDITGADVFAEGIDNGSSNPTMGVRYENMQRMAFTEHWDRLNASNGHPWSDNDWVWAYTFAPVTTTPTTGDNDAE